MIKYNSANAVLSPFNPIVALHPSVRREVNAKFVRPIIEAFFRNKGGISNFEELDIDKIKTEIEFLDTESDESFVKSYIYKEIIPSIAKQDNGEVIFRQRYVITFDEDLAGFEPDTNAYPFKKIFNDNSYEEPPIWYGVIKLGNIPILYYVYIDFQEVIRFIKTLTIKNGEEAESKKALKSPEIIRNNLINQLIAKKQSELYQAPSSIQESIKDDIDRLSRLCQEEVQGSSGRLRINLSWSTTDDLDLHVKSENGEIYYNNDVLETNGVIGKLDIDANAGTNNLISNPQENIVWDGLPKGKHQVFVNLYQSREKEIVPFTIFIENNFNSRIYESYVTISEPNKMREVLEFELKNNELIFTKKNLT